MSEYNDAALTAALLYREHDPLNFKHLALTLNLILQPAELRFRVIHEKPGQKAVLSCRQLHVSINTRNASQGVDDVQRILEAQTNRGMSHSLREKIEDHRVAIEIAVGTGPLPHDEKSDDPQSEALVPLVAQMVTNHLMNSNPADVVYWGETDTVMTPKEFLALINGPAEDEYVAPPPPPSSGISAGPSTDGLAERMRRRSNTQPMKTGGSSGQSGTVQRVAPSILMGNIAGSPPPNASIIDLLKDRFETARKGPKGAFVVSLGTMLFAPAIGALLFVFNFLAGSKFKPTALLALMTAATVLSANLLSKPVDQSASVAPTENSDTANL